MSQVTHLPFFYGITNQCKPIESLLIGLKRPDGSLKIPLAGLCPYKLTVVSRSLPVAASHDQASSRIVIIQ